MGFPSSSKGRTTRRFPVNGSLPLAGECLAASVPCAGGSREIGAARGATHKPRRAPLGVVLAEHGEHVGTISLDAPSCFLLVCFLACGGVYRCHGHLKPRRCAKVCAMSRHWFRSASA